MQKFPPYVGSYIQQKHKFPSGVRNYIRNESRSFLRTLGPIRETKAEASSGRWHLYTKRMQTFLPYVGTYITQHKEEFPSYTGKYIPNQRCFFWASGPIYERKAEVSSGTWHPSTKQKQQYPPDNGSCLPNHIASQTSQRVLTIILLTWRIWWASNNASKWQMGFNSRV